jgi:hypothetical protein
MRKKVKFLALTLGTLLSTVSPSLAAEGIAPATRPG